MIEGMPHLPPGSNRTPHLGPGPRTILHRAEVGAGPPTGATCYHSRELVSPDAGVCRVSMPHLAVNCRRPLRPGEIFVRALLLVPLLPGLVREALATQSPSDSVVY